MLNFRSKMEKDLKQTTVSFKEHMTSHGLLNPSMLSIESCLNASMFNLKKDQLPHNKNYFSAALQKFFRKLQDADLEAMCDNYVEGWIEKELQKKTR